jgi:hypothetical protein
VYVTVEDTSSLNVGERKLYSHGAKAEGKVGAIRNQHLYVSNYVSAKRRKIFGSKSQKKEKV